MKKLLKSPYLVLTGIILLALGIRLYNLNYNSPFLDEAIYAVLGKKVLNGTWQGDSPFTWVGGMPLFFPTLSAIFYNVGGIIGSRMLNVILGICSVGLIFVFVKQLNLFEKESLNNLNGFIASFFFSIAPVPVWLSRLAIYDMLSFTLFLSGLVLLQRGFLQSKKLIYILSAFFFFLSFLAKYTVAMTFPFIVGIFFIYAIFIKKTELKNAILFLTSFLLLVGGYSLIFFAPLREFFTGQVVNAGAPETLDIVQEFLGYMLIWYALAIAGLLLLLRQNKHFLTLTILVLISSIPLLINIVSQNSTTIHQNSLFSLVAVLPLCSSLFTLIIDKRKHVGIGIFFLTGILVIYYSLPVVWNLEHLWPNANSTVTFMEENTDDGEVILSELGDVAYLPLMSRIPPENFYGPYYIEYNGAEGEDAYEEAFSSGLFTTVQLDGTALTLTPEMEASLEQNYQEVHKEGIYTVYKRR